jgi:hypothetical protein
MKPPRNRHRWIERLLIDDAFDADLEWRDESAEARHPYRRWNGAPAREARTSVRGRGTTTCAATPGTSASTCTATGYAGDDIELHLGRTAVDTNTTLQELPLGVMPQHHDGIPVAEHPLERGAS